MSDDGPEGRSVADTGKNRAEKEPDYFPTRETKMLDIPEYGIEVDTQLFELSESIRAALIQPEHLGLMITQSFTADV
ncbi:hypothetical protein ACFL2C_04105 [Patescibacteria group bacterium]